MKAVEEIYHELRALNPYERLKLAQMLLEGALQEIQVNAKGERRSLLELEGLGAEIWEGIDAQEYVDELRKEWDHRP